MSLDRKSCGALLTPHLSLTATSRSLNLLLPGESQFPSPPALSNSLLKLELSLSAFVADLNHVTSIIRSDVGLTAQLLRLAAAESEQSHSRAIAIGEIALNLGMDRVKTLVARTKPLTGFSALSRGVDAGTRFWAHSRLIGQIAEELASQSAEVHPEEAYLAGLLFHLGDLPLLLGWPGSGNADPRHTGYRMAKAWGFPQVLLEVIAGDRELCVRRSLVLLDTVMSADVWASRLRFLAAREAAGVGRANLLTQ